MNTAVLEQARVLFREFYRRDPLATAYAPGRVEVLGNHTDYNEGFVLSAAIGQGTWFLAAPSPDGICRLAAGDLRELIEFPAAAPEPDAAAPWANYVKGVFAGLMSADAAPPGFNGLFLGNVPLGAGLSSSAALEISAGLALAALYERPTPPLELAAIAQRAEHLFAGAKTGLLDQITSLYGRAGRLVHTDFRDLAVDTIPFEGEARFLIVNTGVKHNLVDSEYNQRREECRRAAAHFARVLPDGNIKALRDVSSAEWERHRAGLDDTAARRARHVIGENERVRDGVECLRSGDMAAFGKLLFASHASSRFDFENSCPELDLIVDTAATLDGVLGARLSGGGFGGAVAALVDSGAAESVAQELSAACARRFGHECALLTVRPDAGARLIRDRG